ELRRPSVHRAVASRVHHEVRRQHGAVGQHHRGFGQAFYGHTALQLDAAVRDQLAGPDIDVIARPAPYVLGVDARSVLAEIVEKTHAVETIVEIGISTA